MKIIFIEYPKCSTCQKAKKWLETNNIEFEDRHIVEETPTIKELQKWIPTSNKEIKNWFNTSGLKYKSLNLKEKLQTMTEEEKIAVDKMESERAEEAFRKATKQTLSQRIKKWWKNRKYK